MGEKKYVNPVHGMPGVEFSGYPALLTKEEVITMCAQYAIGTCRGIESVFDSFIEYLEGATGQTIEFRFDDLSIDELQIIDDIVFTCDGCSWNYEIGESHDHNGDNLCGDCYSDRKSEEIEESEDLDDEEYDEECLNALFDDCDE